MQVYGYSSLGQLREASGHYKNGKLLAFDPHRIKTYSKRIMPKKKKNPKSKSNKMMQTYFCVDAIMGQPIALTIGSSATRITQATEDLHNMIKKILPNKALIVADTEHATSSIMNSFYSDEQFDIFMPLRFVKKVQEIVKEIKYTPKWEGYAIGETTYKMQGVDYPINLIVQRTGEKQTEYQYKPFITTSHNDRVEMLSDSFLKRWTIEEFFNFESALGWNRVRTMNLNVRYGKMSLALIAQAVIYQLRQKLPKPYKQWTATHLADSLFSCIDGDIRVQDDRIIVTYYNFPDDLDLQKHYQGLPEKLEKEGVDPRVPWLYNFKVDYRFK